MSYFVLKVDVHYQVAPSAKNQKPPSPVLPRIISKDITLAKVLNKYMINVMRLFSLFILNRFSLSITVVLQTIHFRVDLCINVSYGFVFLQNMITVNVYHPKSTKWFYYHFYIKMYLTSLKWGLCLNYSKVVFSIHLLCRYTCVINLLKHHILYVIHHRRHIFKQNKTRTVRWSNTFLHDDSKLL